MAQTAQRILDEALALSLDERSRIVDRLLASLDESSEAGAQEAWSREIGRRIKALDAGLAETDPWEEAGTMGFGDHRHGQLPDGFEEKIAVGVRRLPKDGSNSVEGIGRSPDPS